MFYFWVIIGMELWGGEIYRGNPLIVGSMFDDYDYYQLSFNNFIYANITCFAMLISWQDILYIFLS